MCDRSLPHKGVPKYHHVTTSRAFIWSPPISPFVILFIPRCWWCFEYRLCKGSTVASQEVPRPRPRSGTHGHVSQFPCTNMSPASHLKIPRHNAQACLGGCEKVAKVQAGCRSGLCSVTLGASPVARGCGPSLSPADRKRRSHTSAAGVLVAGRLRRTHGVICVQGCPRSDQGWARGTRLETSRWWVEGPVGTTHQTKVGGVGSLVIWGPLNGGRVVPHPTPFPSPSRPSAPRSSLL